MSVRSVCIIFIKTDPPQPKMYDTQLSIPLARTWWNRHGKILVGLQMVWVGVGVLWIVGAVVKNWPELLVRRCTPSAGAWEEPDDQRDLNRTLDAILFRQILSKPRGEQKDTRTYGLDDFNIDLLARRDLRAIGWGSYLDALSQNDGSEQQEDKDVKILHFERGNCRWGEGLVEVFYASGTCAWTWRSSGPSAWTLQGGTAHVDARHRWSINGVNVQAPQCILNEFTANHNRDRWVKVTPMYWKAVGRSKADRDTGSREKAWNSSRHARCIKLSNFHRSRPTVGKPCRQVQTSHVSHACHMCCGALPSKNSLRGSKLKQTRDSSNWSLRLWSYFLPFFHSSDNKNNMYSRVVIQTTTLEKINLTLQARFQLIASAIPNAWYVPFAKVIVPGRRVVHFYCYILAWYRPRCPNFN